jgi:hypothetical protein
MAAWRRALGRRVVESRGRWWWETHRGFYRPVHLLARLRADEVRRPARPCWGIHASLRDEDAAEANAALPVHRVPDLGAFDEANLSSNRRAQLRKARRLCELAQVADPRFLAEHGYEVLRSTFERTGYAPAGRLPTRDAYARELEVSLRPGRRFVLGALVEGRLVGYVESYAVDGVAYLEELLVHTDALSTNASTLLQVEFVHLCRRSPGIREVVHGVRAPDDEALTHYKERIGFPVAPVPARLELAPGAEWLIRRRAPVAYYRMTGSAPVPGGGATSDPRLGIRVQNDRRVAAARAASAVVSITCECARLCGLDVPVDIPHYELGRASGLTYFLVRTDHAEPGVDRVVSEHGGFAVVEDTTAVARALRDGRGG